MRRRFRRHRTSDRYPLRCRQTCAARRCPCRREALRTPVRPHREPLGRSHRWRRYRIRKQWRPAGGAGTRALPARWRLPRSGRGPARRFCRRPGSMSHDPRAALGVLVSGSWNGRNDVFSIHTMPEVDSTVNHARIIVPVRNGGARWREAAAALREAVADPSVVAVVDSGSSDGSDRTAAENGFDIERIDPKTFNHGRTRQLAVERFCQGREFVVFLTHDAVLEGRESLTELLAAFRDPQVGAAYGRQLPHRQAAPFEAHMVLFNYGTVSE